MNYGQLKSSVQVTLARQGIRPSDTQLGLWVGDAHTAIDSILEWTRSSTTTASTAGLAYYAVPTGAHKIKTVTYDGDVLEEISHEEYLELVDSASGNGTPTYWTLWGSTVYLHRTPDAVKNIVMWTITVPTALSAAADEPTFPREMHQAIVDYAAMIGYAANGLVQETLGFRMLWEKAVQRTASYSGVAREGPSRVEARGA